MSEYVLIVDDVPAIVDLLISQLSTMGYPCVAAYNGREALKIASKPPHPALVLSDIQMSGLSGLELLRALKRLDENIQVVMVSARQDSETLRHCMQEGAYDYLVKPWTIDDLATTVENAVERNRLKSQEQEYRTNLENLFRLTLAKLAESRDEKTGFHLERIAAYSKKLAEVSHDGPYRDQITSTFIANLYKSSPLHDIGKVAIRDAILLAPRALTAEEVDEMRTHTVIGGDLLGDVIKNYRGETFLRMGMEIAYFHHERWDGSGYPRELAGSAIPLAARMVALVDAYDTITTQRPYKAALDHKEAVRRIRLDSGHHFDPALVAAFLMHHQVFDQIQREMRLRELAVSEPRVRDYA